MSAKPRDRLPVDMAVKQEDKIRMSLSNIIDNINNNNLTYFYPKDESLFKKRIDKLNLKFYIETEKYITNKNDMERCQDQLFIILFKQISLYIEEVERLNLLIREKQEDEKTFKEKLEEMQRRDKEKSTASILINNLRTLNKNLDKKIDDKTKIENKLKNENLSLQRQIKFYQEKLRIDLKKSNEFYGNKKKRNIDELNNSNININSTTNMMSHIDSNSTNFRSNSKESASATGQKISFVGSPEADSHNHGSGNISHSINTSSGHQNKSIESSGMVSPPSSGIYSRASMKTSCKNFNENLTISKILNKKRNYSDNNPNQIKRGVNIVSVSINNRYNEGTATNSNSTQGNVEYQKLKREMTKSSIIHNNNVMKSPVRNEQSKEKDAFGLGMSTISTTTSGNPCNIANAGSSSTLNVMNSPNHIHNNSNPSNNNPNTNNSGSHKDYRGDRDSKDMKKPHENKIMSKNISKNYKDFKIIKSIKMQNKKTDSQDRTNMNINSGGVGENIRSPKEKSINFNYDQTNYFSGDNSLPSEQILASLEDEFNNLEDLEKMLKNAKSYLGDEEVYRVGENDDNINTQLFLLSDEESEGYKSGPSSFPENVSFASKGSKRSHIEGKAHASNIKHNINKIKSFPSVTIDLIGSAEKVSKRNNSKNVKSKK